MTDVSWSVDSDERAVTEPRPRPLPIPHPPPRRVDAPPPRPGSAVRAVPPSAPPPTSSRLSIPSTLPKLPPPNPPPRKAAGISSIPPAPPGGGPPSADTLVQAPMFSDGPSHDEGDADLEVVELDAGDLDAEDLDAEGLDAEGLDAEGLDADDPNIGALEAGALDAGALDAGDRAAAEVGAAGREDAEVDVGDVSDGEGDEAELDANEAETAPPAAVSSPMALDWEDEEDATLVYEREDSPYETEAKVVIDQALAVCDEAPTRRHESRSPPMSVPVTTFAGLSASPAALAPSPAPRPSVPSPGQSGPRWIESSARRRIEGPSGAPAPLPVVTAPPAHSRGAAARGGPRSSLGVGAPSPLPPPALPPVPPTPALGSSVQAGPATSGRDAPDVPRSLPFGRPNEPTLVQPVAGQPAALPPPAGHPISAGGAARAVPSSVPPPFVGEPRIFASEAGRRGPSGRGKIWAALGSAAAVAVAAVVAGVLWMPREGQLEIRVVDGDGEVVPSAEVFLDGKKQCASAPCSVRDVPAGSALVRAVAPGFIGDGAVTAEIGAGDDNVVTIEMRPATAMLKVASSQPGVSVSIDGIARGTLPVDISDLEPGEHEVRFDAGERYDAVTRTILVEAGETEDLGDIVLDVLEGRLEVEVTDPDASVVIERTTEGSSQAAELPAKALRGPFPRTVELDGQATWRVVAKKRGAPDFVEAVDFSDGRADKKVVVSFPSAGEPEPVAVSTPSKASPASASPASASPASASPASASPAHAKPSEVAAPPPPDEPKVAGKTGRLNVNSIPVSRVLVDGAALGETPRVDIELPAGIHTVTFVHPDLGRKSVSVHIKPGQTATAAVKLRD